MNRALRLARFGNTKTYLYAALLADLGLTKGTGTATFTRASASFTVDYAGQKQKMPAGAPCFPGMRRVGDAWVGTQIDGVTTITGTKGLGLWPATVNKCTCWGIPRADAYGSTLVTGTAVKGKIYEIVARVSLDWGAVATLVSGTANTVGAKYLITGVLTFTATETGKECIDYVGTKAYYDTAFNNPITNMTLSGDVAAVLSIVADQAAIDSAIASEIAKGASAWDSSLLVALQLARDNAYKSYDVTTGAGGAGVVTYTGAMEAVATSMAETIRVLAGSCTLSDTSGTYTVTPTGTTYARAKKENFTPAAGATMKLTVAASSQVRFLAPQVESLPMVTMTTPSEGASMSRAADILSYPLAGNMPLTGKRHIPMISWTPKAVVAGRSEVIAKSFVDASNYIQVVSNGVIIYFEKRVAGISEFVTFAITPVVGTTYAIDPWFNADNTMGLKVNGVSAMSGLGSELNSNPNFDDGSIWTTSGVWTLASGVASCAGGTGNLYQIGATIGRLYNSGIDIISISAGSVLISFGAAGVASYTTIGTKSIVGFKVTNSTTSQIYASTFTGSVDNATFKEVYNNSTTIAPVFGTVMYIGSDGKNAINGQVMSLKITDGTTYTAGELEMPASLEMFNNLWMI